MIHCPLQTSVAAQSSIFTGEEEIFAFERTVSRLKEMQTEVYWNQERDVTQSWWGPAIGAVICASIYSVLLVQKSEKAHLFDETSYNEARQGKRGIVHWSGKHHIYEPLDRKCLWILIDESVITQGLQCDLVNDWCQSFDPGPTRWRITYKGIFLNPLTLLGYNRESLNQDLFSWCHQNEAMSFTRCDCCKKSTIFTSAGLHRLWTLTSDLIALIVDIIQFWRKRDAIDI